jgi:hypothetical protein
MRPFKLLSMLGLVLMLSACAHPILKPSRDPRTAIPATDVTKICNAWRPVIYSRLHDTVETIQQIQADNDAHDALCGPPT